MPVCACDLFACTLLVLGVFVPLRGCACLFVFFFFLVCGFVCFGLLVGREFCMIAVLLVCLFVCVLLLVCVRVCLRVRAFLLACPRVCLPV